MYLRQAVHDHFQWCITAICGRKTTLERGAQSLFVKKDGGGATAIVRYADNRRGLVELSDDAWIYGGCLRDKQKAVPFVVETGRLYADLLIQTGGFFRGAQTPVPMEDTFAVMAMLDAVRRSHDGGADEPVHTAGWNQGNS